MDNTDPTITYDQAIEMAAKVTKYMVDNKVEKCLCCAESMSLVSRSLSVQMVQLLAKISRVINDTQTNDVIPAEFTGELTLTRTQYNNLNVLKKHGLIAVLRKVEDKKIHYCITRKGYDFITGAVAIPKTVWSFRNKTVRKSEEVVTVTDIVKEPYTDIRETLFFQPVESPEIDTVLIHRKVRKKKRKNPCPNCTEGEIARRQTVELKENVAIITGYDLLCNKCGYWKHYPHGH